MLLEISFFALAKVGIFDDFLATDGVLMGNFAEVIAKIARMAMFEMLKVCMKLVNLQEKSIWENLLRKSFYLF